MDPQGLEGVLQRRLRREELRHSGFHVAAFAPVVGAGGVLHQGPGSGDFGRHVRQLDLDGLVFADGFAEGLALLGVADRLLEGGL